MTKYSRSALAFFLALLLTAPSSCESLPPAAPLVRLRLAGLPAEANRVVVTIKSGDKENVVEFVANGTDPLDTLTVSFPQSTTGDVSVSILAYDAMNCLIGSGSGALMLTGDDVRELMITMKRPSLTCGTPAAQIVVRVINLPGANGKVVSTEPAPQMPGIDCGMDCEEVYPVGTMLTLHPTASMGSFLGWSGGCTDINDCMLNLAAEGRIEVEATFGVRPCVGWCDESQPGGINQALYGIFGTGPLNIVAVGNNGTILHFDGQSWTPQQASPAITTDLRAVTMPRNGSNFIAVGLGGTILKQSGSTWTKLTDPSGGAALYGVAGVSAGDVYISGANGTLLKGSATSGTFAVEPPNGGANNPPTSMATIDLNAIAAAPSGSSYAFGGEGGYNLRRYDFFGDQYTDGASGNANELHGFWYGSQAIFAVGQTATLVRRGPPNGVGDWPEWTVQTAPAGTSHMRGIWGINDSKVYAVGDNKIILYWDGATWGKVPTPNLSGTQNLRAIWGTGENNIYAVGDSGTILHYRP